MDTGLLILSVVCDLALGAALAFLWWRSRGARPAEADPEAVIAGVSARVEQQLDVRVSSLLERLSALREELRADPGGPTPSMSRRPVPPEAAPEPPRDVGAPSPAPPPAVDAHEEEQLDDLLSSPEFRNGVWPGMDGPFQTASARLLGFLASQGFPEPGVEAHPPLTVGDGNHWDFLVVRSRRAGEEGSRFLVPRNFSRYDPAMHDHLFDVLGRGASLESFVRELRRCAVLRGSGALEELIRPELLKRKGVFVV